MHENLIRVDVRVMVYESCIEAGDLKCDEVVESDTLVIPVEKSDEGLGLVCYVPRTSIEHTQGSTAAV